MKKLIFSVFIFLQSFGLFAQLLGDYRSNIANGVWGTAANWEKWNGSAWVVANAAPTSANAKTITIQSGHYIRVATAVTVNEVTVDVGGRLAVQGAIVLTIADTAGIDLTINGTFVDSSSASTSWGAGSTWIMGASGTLIKNSAASDVNWQGKYSGGISTIPATANWILRKNTANPVITTIGAYYPNLTIEYIVAGTWTTATSSTFQGSTGFPTIKGNFDIGGSGVGGVNFLNQHTFGTTTLVQGNLIIRTGSTLSNYGTGIEVQGDITVSGTLQYDAADARKLIFSGGNAQTFSGAGTVGIYAMTMNKTGNSLTLNRAITVDNLLTFTSGIINTTAANLLTINTAGTVTGANNSSFVNGPVRLLNIAAFTFPVGKGSDYQSLSVSATAAGGGVFWTEAFSNGCSSDCYATSYTGPNGTWTQTLTGGNSGTSNQWYVSCAENGEAATVCGAGCGADPSLHVGSTSLGDIGAAYDACEQSNKRIESPTINCTGKSGITLAFNRIEFGETTFDDATLWYYNGSVWALLSNPVKTACCGGACDGQVQGQWTAYSIALPASADNNANVKIGFNWTNDASCTGTDPSFAVDDITLSAPVSVDFTCEYFYANPQTTFNNVLVPSLDHISMCEYWILTRNSGSTTKTVTLEWDANSCGVTLLSDLRVARWDGAVWQNEGNTATTGTTSAGTISSVVVANFSPFTHSSVSSQNPLPVGLVSFTAKYNGKTVDLQWQTASETNNDYFTVERTKDGNSFSEIAKVESKANNGNSSSTLNYTAEDISPLNGNSYYRLKQTDINGESKLSNLVPVNIEKEIPLEIVAIASNGNTTLSVLVNCICKSELSVEIFDATGRKVVAEKLAATQNSFRFNTNISSLASGVYLLKVTNGEEIAVKKFIL